MLSSKAPRSTATRLFAAGAVLTLGALSLSACGGSSPSASSTGSASGEKVGVALIVKTTTNPYFVAMEDAAKEAADAGRREAHARRGQGGRRRGHPDPGHRGLHLGRRRAS